MFKLLKKLTLTQWLMILVSIGLIVMQVWLDLELPSYMEKITQIINDPTKPADGITQILINGGYMMLCALGSLLGAVIVGFIMSRLAASFSENLRLDIFRKIDSFSQAEIKDFSTESLITRTTNDVMQVQNYITMGAQLLIKAPILAIWAIIKIAGKGYEWTLATGVTLALLMVVILLVMFIVVPKFKQIQTKMDDLTKATRENLTGVRVIRAYNAETYQEEKFRKANRNLTDITLFTSRSMSILMPVMNFLMSGLGIAIYWIGAVLINNLGLDIVSKANTFGSMVVFSQYAMQVIMAFMMLVMIFIMLPRSMVSAKRINEVLDKEPSIKNGDLKTIETETKGTIEFRNVSFKYPSAEEYILKDINLKVEQGQTVAFIGSTGSGKSTLINLIPRFYDVTEGEVLFNDIDVRAYQLSDLYDKIGYVSQKAVLFKGSVRDNINLGLKTKNTPDDDQVWHSLEIAQGKNFVKELPEQLDDDISQSGTNLSGGQKQRISIARAINKKPEIFIFDDSFSALDYKTDYELRKALKKETKNVTSFIVAQRIGTIMEADQIIVLDQGKIVGKGKHKDLLKNCEVYKEIAMSQLTEEELS